MSYQILSLLLEHGADTDVIDNSGESPLSYALRKKLIKCSLSILKKTKQLNFRAKKDGNSYLHLAVLTENESIVNTLIKKGLQNDSNLNNKNKLPSDLTKKDNLKTVL